MLDKNWKAPKTSIEQFLAKIRGKYNEAILVSVVVGPDDKNSSVNILQVGHSAFDRSALLHVYDFFFVIA